MGAPVAADSPFDATVKLEPLAVGAALPGFTVPDDTGQTWHSADHVGKKVVVLYFYPGDFTGGCTRQAELYRDALVKIENLGAEVVGVSGDKAETHKLFKKSYGLTHALLADSDGELAKLLGIPVKAGGKVRAIGPDRKPLLDAEGERIVIERPVTFARWTVVVGRDGKIASLRSNVNPVKDAEEVLAIVAGL
jgi:peroxiredoxin Q/BCP